MGKKIKFTELNSGETYEIDEDDCSKGPVKIKKPKGKYITPDKLPGVKNFSEKTEYLGKTPYSEFKKWSDELAEKMSNGEIDVD